MSTSSNSKKDIVYPYSCIYKITLPNNKGYVGSTPDLKQRIETHKHPFNNPKHKDNDTMLIYKAAREFPGDFDTIFKFNILEEFNNIKYADLHQKEREYMIIHKTHVSEGGYNQQQPNRDAQKDRKEEKAGYHEEIYQIPERREQILDMCNRNYHERGGKELKQREIICICGWKIKFGDKSNHENRGEFSIHKYLMSLTDNDYREKEIKKLEDCDSPQARTAYISKQMKKK